MVVSSRCLLMIGAAQCSTPAAHRQQIGVGHRRLIGAAHLRDVGSTHTQRRAPIPGGPATVPAASPWVAILRCQADTTLHSVQVTLG